MMSLQHVICTFIRCEGDMDFFKRELPFAVLPDAIRVYLGTRVLSHFEVNPEQTDVSWYRYPTDIKHLTKVDALLQDNHQAETDLKSVIGEKSDIQKFVEVNKDLPIQEFHGILTHLVQDLIFDAILKETYDMSHKYGEDAYFQERETGKKYSGKEFRELLAELELYGYLYLARYCYRIYGIDINQEWLDQNIYPILLEAYPEDLANTTYKYMHLPDWMNEKITNHDFSGLNDENRNIDYDVIYRMIMRYTKDLNYFHKWEEPKNTEPPKQKAA